MPNITNRQSAKIMFDFLSDIAYIKNMTQPIPSTPQTMDLILQGLCSAIGAQWRLLPAWFVRLSHTRVNRFRNAIVKLLKLLATGAYRAPAPRVRKPSATPRPPYVPAPIVHGTAVPAGARLPTGFNWLTLRFIRDRVPGHDLAGQRGNLELQLLKNAELRAAIAACPALARQFRPLCHLLGIPLPDYLKLPPRERKPRAPRPPRARAPALPAPAEPAPPPPRPLPYGVVTSFEGPYRSPTLSICGLKNWP